MLLLSFLISLSLQRIAAQPALLFNKRLPKSLPVNDLTFIAYEKRKPMFAEYGKRGRKLPTFAEYGKRVPKFAEYGKRAFSGVGTKWINKYNAMMQ